MCTRAGRLSIVFASLVLVLACAVGCTSRPAVEPITKAAESLQGHTIDVPLDSSLNITTGQQPVTNYLGTIATPSIAKFVRGKKTSTAEFDPAIQPLKVGVTKVTLTITNGSGQYITFTLHVVKAGSVSG